MSGTIYLLGDNGALQPMTESLYDSEGLLQRLLADYPDLLAGEQMHDTAPRRWLLIRREMGVPLEGGAGLMSLDHLFVDQDGVPTLVEVKRSTDPRVRREVVGQMIDYASHAVAHWSVDTLRTAFEASYAEEGEDAAQVVSAFLESDAEDAAAVDGFWQQVGTNLRAGRIRLLFVADNINAELRRAIEFLNRFMDPVEVLGVEVRQYVGRGLKTLVPRVVGRSAAAERKAAGSSAPARQWDEETFFADLARRVDAPAVEVARALLKWAQRRVTYISWGRGKSDGSFVPVLQRGPTKHQLFAITTRGTFEVYFQHYRSKAPFDSEAKRLELLGKLNKIDTVRLTPEAVDRRPSFSLAQLVRPECLRVLLETFDWVVQEIEAAS